MTILGTLTRSRWRAFLNLRHVLAGQSSFKILFILAFAVGMITGLWAIFAQGFSFLDSLGGVGFVVIPRLFALFFFGLSFMLVLSGVLTTYMTLFRSDEIPFLMLNPIGITPILIFKHLESALYSSWAFLFIIVPFVGAYAFHENLPWYFTVWTLLFSIPFMYLMSVLGSLITLIVVRWGPRKRYVPMVICLIILAVVAWYMVRPSGTPGREDSVLFLRRLVPGLQMASMPLWPSWWVSEGILSLTRGQFEMGLLFWLLLTANCLMAGLLFEGLGRGTFYDAWQRVISESNTARRKEVMLRPLERVLWFIPSDLRTLTLKDIRTFLRDPQQWLQFLIFFGLLGIYFFNLRTFKYHTINNVWRNVIAFLNVFSTSAVMCSLGSRFVFPQMSLEGQAFWTVGMAPTSMRRVLLAKFTAACFCMVILSSGLISVSVFMLRAGFIVSFVMVSIATCVGLVVSGMSTGLGAVFLDLRQRNPAAIVSGFGGTLNLVLCLVFMLVVIMPFGAIFHLYYLGQLDAALFRRMIAWGFVGLVLLTTVFTAGPLAAGVSKLTRMEY